MRWRAVGLILLPLLLLACSRTRDSKQCPPAPYFVPLVAGSQLGPGQLSGNGFYCGTIGDGVTAEALDPAQARPGDAVLVQYQSKERWDELTFSIYRGQEAVRTGKLPHRTGGSFQLPEQPGTYTVSIQGQSGHGRTTAYFRVTISR